MKKIIIFFLRLYQIFVSPLLILLFGKGCIYTPTCSQYTVDAVKKYGFKGLFMGLKRLSTCHPGGQSKYDPVK